jgi:hypothetical protein
MNAILIWFMRIVAGLRSAVVISPGYQDVTGFHTGVEPDRDAAGEVLAGNIKARPKTSF